MEEDDQLTITLGVKQRDGIVRPLVHVLTHDGRVTEFRDRGAMVMADEAVYALLINGKGEVMYTADGLPAVAPVPALQIATSPDPDKLIRWKDVVRLAGGSESTVERWSKAGLLPKPVKVRAEGRAVVFREVEVREALRKIADKG